MNAKKQVDRSHYEFSHYMDKGRWDSVWHQLDEVARVKPSQVLEIGPGPGVFKSVASQLGLNVETMDTDPDLKPDHLGSATDIPILDDAYDVVCAFQMLEHLPYCDSLRAFREMARVSRRYIIISLPNAKPVWRCQLQVPRKGVMNFLLSNPFWKPRQHQFDGEHYWEINVTGFPLSKVLSDLSNICKLERNYRVYEKPHHHFFVFRHERNP